MKVKSKKKIILCCCISLILLLLLADVYIFQFTGLGYRMSVPYRSSFEKVADNIYVNKNRRITMYRYNDHNFLR